MNVVLRVVDDAMGLLGLSVSGELNRALLIPWALDVVVGVHTPAGLLWLRVLARVLGQLHQHYEFVLLFSLASAEG